MIVPHSLRRLTHKSALSSWARNYSLSSAQKESFSSTNKHMPEFPAPSTKFKRFYKEATVTEHPMSSSVKKLQWEDPITTENLSQSHDTYWAVKIDNHILKTSLKEDLLIPSRALAVAIAEEWDSQGETMDITTLHLYNMMTKAVAAQNNSDLLGHMKRECSRILENDEICYQEDPNSKNEFKKDLALQQIDKYGVLLDYLKQEFDVHLKVWTHVSIE